MNYRLLQTLGTSDALFCNKNFNASITTDAGQLAIGCVVDLPKDAVEWLISPKGRGMPGMLEPVNAVKAQAKAAELTAPSK